MRFGGDSKDCTPSAWGVYRIIYELRDEDATVRVIAIRHRAEAYQTDPR